MLANPAKYFKCFVDQTKSLAGPPIRNLRPGLVFVLFSCLERVVVMLL